MNRALTTLAACAAVHRNTPVGASLETALIAAVIADQHPIPEMEAVRLAEKDRWDDRVRVASRCARLLIDEAHLELQAVTA
ncbi:hypothetical protein [Nonomuraea turcica]|uniref:hypothetical protein n=1 Tax=Nonomuraea sp. G32 TaxID=3067274 RepID=UPI00273B0F7D|nr:hypothetical protein [Nonomuraea sp. G32]MDP4501001.1 hypothetical protein [Nonomuraea sp. G32]